MLDNDLRQMALRNTSLGNLTRMFLAANPNEENKRRYYVAVKKPAFSAKAFIEIYGLLGAFPVNFQKIEERRVI